MHHVPYQQLEQGCFGYEPTVWRTMPGDCQQAVRMIPNEHIELPKEAETAEPTPAEETTPVQEGQEGQEGQSSEKPIESLLNEVPESSPLDLPRIVQPDAIPESPAPADMPAEPPAKSPAEPPAAAPQAEPPAAKQPAAEPPAAEPKPAEPAPTEPKQPQPESTGGEQSDVSGAFSQPLPVITQPAVAPASVSARALFRTVHAALNESAQTKVAARHSQRKQSAAANLSRFISY